MRFHAKKIYGESGLKNCPFCGKLATRKTQAGLEVCHQHTKEQLHEIKCTCGRWLEQRVIKFGPYFNCLNCGNINFKKAIEMKGLMGERIPPKPEPVVIERKETIITSRDVEYFD